MKRPNNLVLISCVVAILLTILFPPYYFEFKSNIHWVGFGVVFTGPFDAKYINRARIDIEVLLTIWGGILIAGALASQLDFYFLETIQKRVEKFSATVKVNSTKIIIASCLILILLMSGYYLNQMIVNGCFSENETSAPKFGADDTRVDPLDFSASSTVVEPEAQSEKPDFSALGTKVE